MSTNFKNVTDPAKLEKIRERLKKKKKHKKVHKLDAYREKLVDKQRAKAEGWSKGRKGSDLKGSVTARSGKALSKYNPQALTFTQNMKALGHEMKPGKNWRPDKVVKKGWKNLGEGSGGYSGGKGYGRYNPLGGKSMTGMFALGDAKDAVNRSDPTGKERSRTERTGYMLGGALGGTAGALSAKSVGRFGAAGMPVNLALSLGGMAAGYWAGGKAGKAVDAASSKVRGVEAGDYTRTQRARIKKKIRSL